MYKHLKVKNFAILMLKHLPHLGLLQWCRASTFYMESFFQCSTESVSSNSFPNYEVFNLFFSKIYQTVHVFFIDRLSILHKCKPHKQNVSIRNYYLLISRCDLSKNFYISLKTFSCINNIMTNLYLLVWRAIDSWFFQDELHPSKLTRAAIVPLGNRKMVNLK